MTTHTYTTNQKTQRSNIGHRKNHNGFLVKIPLFSIDAEQSINVPEKL